MRDEHNPLVRCTAHEVLLNVGTAGRSHRRELHCGFLISRTPARDREQNRALHADAVDEDLTTFRLYHIGENEFGRKRGMLKLTFGDGCLMFDDFTCKKL